MVSPSYVDFFTISFFTIRLLGDGCTPERLGVIAVMNDILYTGRAVYTIMNFEPLESEIQF